MTALDAGAKVEMRIQGAGKPTSPVGNLVRHVARDLHDGLVSVGGMGTRGYGRVAVVNGALLEGLDPIDVPALLASVPASETKGEADGRP